MGERLEDMNFILDTRISETVKIRLSEYKALLQKATTVDILRLTIMDRIRNSKSLYHVVDEDLVMLLTDTLDAYREALSKQEAKE